jgi:hypothetical protein
MACAPGPMLSAITESGPSEARRRRNRQLSERSPPQLSWRPLARTEVAVALMSASRTSKSSSHRLPRSTRPPRLKPNVMAASTRSGRPLRSETTSSPSMVGIVSPLRPTMAPEREPPHLILATARPPLPLTPSRAPRDPTTNSSSSRVGRVRVGPRQARCMTWVGSPSF